MGKVVDKSKMRDKDCMRPIGKGQGGGHNRDKKYN